MDEDAFTEALRKVMAFGRTAGHGDSYIDDYVCDAAPALRDICIASLTESEREAITCAYVNSITDPHRAAVLAERDKTETDAAS